MGAKIGEIVTAGTQAALARTGVLGDPGAAGQAYSDFHERFRRVPAQLKILRETQFWKDDLIMVDDTLPASMAALAGTEVKDGQPAISMKIRSSLVTGEPGTLTDQAIKLFHELAHTIFDKPDFLVKDFAYGRVGQVMR